MTKYGVWIMRKNTVAQGVRLEKSPEAHLKDSKYLYLFFFLFVSNIIVIYYLRQLCV